LLGANGFLGRSLARAGAAAGLEVAPITRAQVDLAAEGAAARLAPLLRAGDCVVVLAALTPDRGRGLDIFLANMRIIEAVVGAITAAKPAHAVYISSDAVYGRFDPLIAEDTPADPADLYGAMHRSRELAMATCGVPLAILRPTLIYGAEDTHNSYGPNRFRRMAAEKGEITLFGEGEETRDHVFVDDVAALILEVVRHRSCGILNIATGNSISYADLARLAADLHGGIVKTTRRQNPITHRAFDPTATLRAFPNFRFVTLQDGLANVARDLARCR
jgi:nucleoside-diphosphate-sugar epimerase